MARTKASPASRVMPNRSSGSERRQTSGKTTKASTAKAAKHKQDAPADKRNQSCHMVSILILTHENRSPVLVRELLQSKSVRGMRLVWLLSQSADCT